MEANPFVDGFSAIILAKARADQCTAFQALDPRQRLQWNVCHADVRSGSSGDLDIPLLLMLFDFFRETEARIVRVADLRLPKVTWSMRVLLI